MATYAIWRSRPVFVTSTFRDMHAERDHLHAVVFPAIEERLRARFHYLEPIDLRLGVETREGADPAAREILILKVCLDEIRRSRPFLIGLIGDRYGWVPPDERMAAAAREAGFDRDLAGRSVTALEVEFGVLGSREQQRRSRFYLREPLPYDRMESVIAAQYSEAHMQDAGAVERRRRLEDLKALLHRELPADRVRSYRAGWDPLAKRVKDLEPWGRQVIEDLWVDLEAEIAAVAPPATWQEQEARLLDAFVATSCPEFVGREEVRGRLVEVATGHGSPDGIRAVCVVGPAGSGKSALFAELHRTLRQRDVILLAHAGGIGPRSSDVDTILRRWCFELSAAIGIADPSEGIPGRDELRDAFSSLLSRAAAGRRVVCLIDALDQLERSASGMHSTWLPEGWPENACLITTAIPGSESAGLMSRRRWVGALALEPLTGSEAEAIARTVARRRHADVRPELLGRLTSIDASPCVPASGNPLWLELALEEVLLLDEDDFIRAERAYEGSPDARLHALRMDVAGQLPATVEELYDYLLERMEKVHGESLVREFATLMAASRSGWRESDLRLLLPARSGEPWDELRVAALRRGFRAHLAQRGSQGQWDFTHSQMRQAVRRGHLNEKSVAQGVHAAIANHLERFAADDPLRQTELMHHLLRSGDMKRAARHYAGDLDPGSLAGATAGLAAEILDRASEGATAGGRYMRSLLVAEAISDTVRGAICHRCVFELWEGLKNLAPLDLKLEIQLEAKRVLDRLASSHPREAHLLRLLSVSHERLADVLVAKGDLRDALATYRTGLAVMERLVTLDPANVRWQQDLSVCHSKVGGVLEAQGNLHGALEAYRAGLVVAERLATSDPGNAGWQREVSAAHCLVGIVLQQQGNLTGALEAYEAYRVGMERLVSSDLGNARWQRDLSVSHERIGDVLMAQGNVAGALEAFQRTHEILDRLASLNPGNHGWQRDLLVTHNKMGDVLAVLGNRPDALEAYRSGLVIAARLVSSDPGNTGWARDLSISHNKVGDVLMAQGTPTDALEAYQAGLVIAERLATLEPGNAEWQRDLAISHDRIGNAQRARGELHHAREAYLAGLLIAEHLATSDPGNADWQRDMTAYCFKLGKLANLPEEARGYWERCLCTFRAMLDKGMHLDPQSRQVLGLLERMLGPRPSTALPGAAAMPPFGDDPDRAKD